MFSSKLLILEALRRQQRYCSMACRFCKSQELRVLTAEMNIHFPGNENLDTPTVWVFPPVTICLHCGCADFVVHGEPLQMLRDNDAKPKSA
jgi:hypothetical protein